MTNEKLAPNNTSETAHFLRDLVVANVRDYPRKCLQVQREARGLNAVYPTALSASNATPKSERVYDLSDWRRGMVGFSFNPAIPGTAGHIFFVNGRDSRGRILTCTNDAYEVGAMDYVPVEFYTEKWGHKIQFAATWLNGYDFSDFNAKPKPVNPGNLGEQYRHAYRILKDVHQRKLEKLGPTHPLVIGLERDLDKMRKNLTKYDGQE